MNEEIILIIETAKESMLFSIQHLERELINIRAGKANPVMLKNVMVEYYGTPTPLSQLSNINTPDGRTITIQPWEKSILPEIEKGILNANLGFNPMNNGESILINIPPLTQERRVELVKLAKSLSENAKVSIRNCRKDANNEIRKSEFSEDVRGNYELDIQEITDTYVKKVDNIFSSKETEILKV